jgi:hypothetical protein
MRHANAHFQLEELGSTARRANQFALNAEDLALAAGFREGIERIQHVIYTEGDAVERSARVWSMLGASLCAHASNDSQNLMCFKKPVGYMCDKTV